MARFERAEGRVKDAPHCRFARGKVPVVFVKRRRKAVSNGIVHHYESMLFANRSA